MQDEEAAVAADTHSSDVSTPDANSNPKLTGSDDADGITSTPSQADIDKHPVVKRVLANRGNWKAFQYGNHKLFCNGMIKIAPVRHVWWLFELLVVFVFVVFIWESITYKDRFHLILKCSGSVIFVVHLLSAFKTLCCDPGIIPKPDFDTALANAREAVRKGLMPTRQFVVEHRIASFRYCYQCNHYKPAGTGHCGICGTCVEKFDHHCPVFGGCVGKKNFYAFEMMCFTIAAFFVFMLIAGSVTFSKRIGQQGVVVNASLIFSACYTFDVTVIGLLLMLFLWPFITGPPIPSEEYSRPRSILKPPQFYNHNRIRPISPGEIQAAKAIQLMSGDYYLPVKLVQQNLSMSIYSQGSKLSKQV